MRLYRIIEFYPSSLTPGGSMVKLKKMAQFFWFRGSVRSLEMAFNGVNASFTAIVILTGLWASCCLM